METIPVTLNRVELGTACRSLGALAEVYKREDLWVYAGGRSRRIESRRMTVAVRARFVRAFRDVVAAFAPLFSLRVRPGGPIGLDVPYDRLNPEHGRVSWSKPDGLQRLFDGPRFSSDEAEEAFAVLWEAMQVLAAAGRDVTVGDDDIRDRLRGLAGMLTVLAPKPDAGGTALESKPGLSPLAKLTAAQIATTYRITTGAVREAKRANRLTPIDAKARPLLFRADDAERLWGYLLGK